MKELNKINQVKPKAYTVEILASFELELVHQFSDTDIKNAGGLISSAFDELIQDIKDSFSPDCISVYFEGAKRRRIDGKYKFTGSISRYYKFPEKDIDLFEGELIDGTFDSQLNEMKLNVQHICNNCGYDLTIIYFGWADDEVIEEANA